MESSEKSSLLIRIDPRDNVAVLRRTVSPGETLIVAGVTCQFRDGLALGHKVAVETIRTEEKVIKYGAPIGSATRDIAIGDHVHLHNMRSDYMTTYTLEEGGRYGDRH